MSRMCSRVCGIGPSVAETTRIGAVHLRGAGDHVLDVVGVTGAIDVRVVALRRLVLLVRNCDRNAALFFLGRVVDVVDVALRDVGIFGRQAVDDRRRERRLAMVDVTRRADVDVWFLRSNFALAMISFLYSFCFDLRDRPVVLTRSRAFCLELSRRFLPRRTSRRFLVVRELHRIRRAALRR